MMLLLMGLEEEYLDALKLRRRSILIIIHSRRRLAGLAVIRLARILQSAADDGAAVVSRKQLHIEQRKAVTRSVFVLCVIEADKGYANTSLQRVL